MINFKLHKLGPFRKLELGPFEILQNLLPLCVTTKVLKYPICHGFEA